MKTKLFFISLFNLGCMMTGSLVHSQCFKLIEGGGVHTIGIKSDGTLWAWGQNYSYQLGDGTSNNQSLPIKIGNDNSWSQITSGELFNLAIKTDGTLWGWGDNYKGVLGDGTQTSRSSPVKIGTSTDWKLVEAGYDFTLAIKNDGTLWSWGNNSQGQLGNGSNTESLIPKKIGSDNNWVYVIAGYQHALAMKSDGTIWSWGYNLYGQLGIGNKINQNIPTKIGTSSDWKKIVAKSNHTLALKNDGTIWGWGSNYSGEVGNDTVTYADVVLPEKISSESDWKDIFAGAASSHAIKSDGTRWSWGSNTYSEQGNGNNLGFYTKPTKVGFEDNWKTIFTGTRHVFGIQGGILMGWGFNNYNQIGSGTVTNYIKSPVNIGCAVLNTFEIGSNKTNVLYPNPTKDFINISGVLSKNAQLLIYDNSGKVIKNIKNRSENATIDVRDLSIGLYLMEIIENDRKEVFRFLKQ